MWCFSENVCSLAAKCRKCVTARVAYEKHFDFKVVMVTASHHITVAEQEGYVSVRARGGFSSWTLHSEGTVKGRMSMQCIYQGLTQPNMLISKLNTNAMLYKAIIITIYTINSSLL